MKLLNKIVGYSLLVACVLAVCQRRMGSKSKSGFCFGQSRGRFRDMDGRSDQR